MSAEGKKKRGISGMSNAKTIPFRYGGSKCNISTRIGSTNHPRLAGSRLVQAMHLEGALRASGLVTTPFVPSHRMQACALRALHHTEHGHKTVIHEAMAA